MPQTANPVLLSNSNPSVQCGAVLLQTGGPLLAQGTTPAAPSPAPPGRIYSDPTYPAHYNDDTGPPHYSDPTYPAHWNA